MYGDMNFSVTLPIASSFEAAGTAFDSAAFEEEGEEEETADESVFLGSLISEIVVTVLFIDIFSSAVNLSAAQRKEKQP